MQHIVVTPEAEEDLESHPEEVRSTFYSKIESVEKNLTLGAKPDQVFNKRLSGNMHPALQMSLGRDFRACFIEGKYIKTLEDGKIYCFKVLTKEEAIELTDRIFDVISYLRS